MEASKSLNTGADCSLQDRGTGKREGGQPSLTAALEVSGYKEEQGAPPWVGVLGELPISRWENCLVPPLDWLGS